MRQKSSPPETPSERLVRDIRQATRKQYSAEEKIRIVLEGLRGADSIVELYRPRGPMRITLQNSACTTPVLRADAVMNS